MEGKRAVVTGASKGIGFASARALAAEGADVVLVARDPETLQSAAARLRAESGSDVEVHPGDLSDASVRTRLAEIHGDADVLVNNAGAIPGGDLFSIDFETWRSAWNLKVFGYVHMTQLFLDRMRHRGSGTIVNVIGSAGRAPRGDYVCGATGNAALIAFTEAVGGWAPDFGVRVVGVNPGPTATERYLGRPVDDDGPEDDELADRFPNVRVARASAVADLVVYLASERARVTSGVVVDADHGQLRRVVVSTGPPSPKGSE